VGATMDVTILAVPRNELSHISQKNKIVAIVDVLRATSTIVSALANGSSIVIPVESVEEAYTIRSQISSNKESAVILAGEINNIKIEGFDVGNSPYEFSIKHYRKPIILKTTNGTPLVKLFNRAPYLIALSFLNISSTSKYISRIANDYGLEILIVEAGDESKISYPDHLCSLYFLCSLKKLEYPKIDVYTFLRESPHGKSLVRSNCLRDISFSSKIDIYNVVALFNGLGFIPLYV